MGLKKPHLVNLLPRFLMNTLLICARHREVTHAENYLLWLALLNLFGHLRC
jgi:hypothetical protein